MEDPCSGSRWHSFDVVRTPKPYIDTNNFFLAKIKMMKMALPPIIIGAHRAQKRQQAKKTVILGFAVGALYEPIKPLQRLVQAGVI